MNHSPEPWSIRPANTVTDDQRFHQIRDVFGNVVALVPNAANAQRIIEALRDSKPDLYIKKPN